MTRPGPVSAARVFRDGLEDLGFGEDVEAAMEGLGF
jgi:hypothetical protein